MAKNFEVSGDQQVEYLTWALRFVAGHLLQTSSVEMGIGSLRYARWRSAVEAMEQD